ncbi:hypothetical protein EW146_g6525 [Bondarzewia mesenterica]|uniref:Uncharacterized protein n=1 Tax=Bondarzewia mesenterica TaxID=1095465 RepID=A0A4S4LP79_9AGAM|nr:hypothetical protein EW146_g6525 [Bondarzewia mesenterica]
MDTETFLTTVGGDAFVIRRDSPRTHRYTIRPITSSATSNGRFVLSVGYSTTGIVHKEVPAVENVIHSSVETWQEYWSRAGFLDLITGSTDPRVDELQHRVVLSRYLMRVNEAGDTPPQESGLVNDGWYGKFHMEMYFWHSAHWALWSNWDLLHPSSSVYVDFLPTSLARVQIQQSWASGARWPKMTNPSGRSSPGEINNLLIWDQPHPLVFAEYERHVAAEKNDGNAERRVLEMWKDVIRATADWMAVFAWWNSSTEVYDPGPPMFVVSEDTSLNVTMNPAFELVYWRFLQRSGFFDLDYQSRMAERHAPEQYNLIERERAQVQAADQQWNRINRVREKARMRQISMADRQSSASPRSIPRMEDRAPGPSLTSFPPSSLPSKLGGHSPYAPLPEPPCFYAFNEVVRPMSSSLGSRALYGPQRSPDDTRSGVPISRGHTHQRRTARPGYLQVCTHGHRIRTSIRVVRWRMGRTGHGDHHRPASTTGAACNTDAPPYCPWPVSQLFTGQRGIR